MAHTQFTQFYTHTHRYTNIHTNIYTHIHKHIHTYIHTSHTQIISVKHTLGTVCVLLPHQCWAWTGDLAAEILVLLKPSMVRTHCSIIWNLFGFFASVLETPLRWMLPVIVCNLTILWVYIWTCGLLPYGTFPSSSGMIFSILSLNFYSQFENT